MTPAPAFPRAEFMRRALRLARKGAGRTAPNPAVGAVVVRGGRVVGEGYHHAAGLPHAEIEALRAAGSAARGADLYVTLEPCNHHGRTGPCTDAVLAAGIARVAYALEDPNPAVSGGGARKLRDAGLVVHRGVMEAEAREVNRGFCRWVVAGKPFVTLKLAVSLDGQIAAAGGDSRWITSEAARRRVHRMRSGADAVLVGGETARRDDPLLTARVPGGHDPRRVVLTSRPAELVRGRIFREPGGDVIVACPKSVPERYVRAVREAGGTVLRLPVHGGAVRAGDFLAALGGEGITSLLVEGGGRTAGWLVSEGAVDRYVVFVAPLLLGEGVRAVSGWARRSPASGKRLVFTSVRRVGPDLEITAEER
ncbi:MAG: bifunctional diaminohydroxyphosphoribosylaminopyrimidine deaminase/5-amino-6-(5-phosphoribosylamino)uracil reductase RibD [bacterium]|jgi:diaminohydroxyphosphoribosylaminopyrimidine deaminase/5-amino-6-(5-phosphoribosylamino)uracil reductase